MATIDEQIKSLEEEIGKTQKNKATNAHIGKLKAKIAALKARKEKAQAIPNKLIVYKRVRSSYFDFNYLSHL